MGKDAEPKPIGFFVEQALDRIAGGDRRPATPPGQAMLRRYRLELVATGTDEEATRKLRGMLKMALRGFGLRCVEAVEIRDEEAPPRRGEGSSGISEHPAVSKVPIVERHTTNLPFRKL